MSCRSSVAEMPHDADESEGVLKCKCKNAARRNKRNARLEMMLTDTRGLMHVTRNGCVADQSRSSAQAKGCSVNRMKPSGLFFNWSRAISGRFAWALDSGRCKDLWFWQCVRNAIHLQLLSKHAF